MFVRNEKCLLNYEVFPALMRISRSRSNFNFGSFFTNLHLVSYTDFYVNSFTV
jgi:hypothetical protein